MLSTPCELCCFHDPQQKHCAARQHSEVAGDTVLAPGFCRLYRTPAWLKKQLAAKPEGRNLPTLIAQATRETDLRYDAMVLYDERLHTPDMLKRSISFDEPAEQIIVIDLTGSDDRKGTALQVMKECCPIAFKVECLMDSTSIREAAIDIAFRLVGAPYFLVLEAGRRVVGLANLKLALRTLQSRAVYWHFPMLMSRTRMVSPRTTLGVYLSAAFKRLGGNQGKPFSAKLREHEDESGWSLSWLFDRGCIL